MKHMVSERWREELARGDGKVDVADLIEIAYDTSATRVEFRQILTAYAKEVFLAGARFAGSKGALAEDSAHAHLLNCGLPAVTIEVEDGE